MPSSNPSAKLMAAASILFFLAFSSHGQCQSSAKQAEALEARLPLLFEQNVGQTNAQVRYLAHSGRYQIYLTHNAAVLKVAGEARDAVLKATLRKANENATVVGVEQQAAKTNYLLGARSAWKTGVPTFAAVEYEAVYPGIDLKYYSKQRQLEYDFDVAPHADPSMISFNMEGAKKIRTDKDGSLVLKTAAGKVRWLKPVAYQQSETGRQVVSAAYRVQGKRISFELGAYDSSRSLVIDPSLVYGTFLDGSGFERYNSFVVDSAGYSYIVGETGSSDFPTTPGAYQQYHTQNYAGEVFVSKLSQDGSYLVWSTILGGTGPNNASFPNGLTLDADDNVYIVGSTGDFINNSDGSLTFYASTFPTSSNAYNHAELAAWRFFLVKLNSSGSALDYSTFLSNQPNIIAYAVAVDSANNAYVTGEYNHASGFTAPFPATPGAYQSTYGGDNDAFIMKFNSTATALDYATLVGGVHDDVADQILVSSDGDATIDGYTYSPNYPITANGKQQTDEGGFITTLNSAGTGLVYSTVLNHVLSPNVKRDNAGYYYVGGTAGTNLPTTANAFQKTFPATGSGIHLGFLTEIDPSGNLVYSSYLAGNPPFQNEDTQVQLVSPNSVVIAGNRNTDPYFPVTDRTYEQDSCSFLAKFNTQASGRASLVYSGCTPINQTDNQTVEQFRGIAYFNASQLYLDGNNKLYGLNTFGQTSPNAFQKAPPQQSSGDGYYVWTGKYDLTQPGPGGVNLSAPVQENLPYSTPVTFRATGRSPQCSSGVAAMRVYTSPGVIAYTTMGATLDANISFAAPNSNTHVFNPVIVVYDNCGKGFSMTVPIIVQGPPQPGDPNVVSPTNAGVVTSPVHFVASASAPNCSKGISAIRIYTAPGVGAYTVNGASLDKYLNMATGTYNVVVQAWDNCGGVYKTPLTITVE
jgi:hypothetical protein